MNEKLNIIFLEGLEPRHNRYTTYIGYLFPIASVLECNNLRFKIISVKNLVDYSVRGLINELKKYQFDAVGMTTNADSIRFVYKVSEAVKKEFPDVKIILGGAQVTYADTKTLEESACDIVIRNEGELKLVELLECIRTNTDYGHIKGISYKIHDRVYRNEDSLPPDINTLPVPQYAILVDPAYWIIPEGMDESEFRRVLGKIKGKYPYFMTGRGCPNKCAFCVEGNIKNKYRFRNGPNVKRDLEYYLSVTGNDYIVIGDDTFTSSIQRVNELCGIFKEVQKKYPFNWYCEGRVDVISRHPEILSVMYDAGLRKLQLGIESGNQKTLDLYNKKITLQQMEIVVKEATKYQGLLLHGNIIMGNPKETFDEYKESLEFIKHLVALSNFNLDISKTYLTPYFGTPIRMYPEKYGVEILVEDFEFTRFGMNEVVCKPDSLSIDELNSLAPLTDHTIQLFINDNIYKLPKKTILNRYLDDQPKGEMPTTWIQSFTSLRAFRKYLRIAGKKITVEGENVDLDSADSILPLRLWDVAFDRHEKVYSFISLKDEKVVMDGYKVSLWEMATGKKSIAEICSDMQAIDICCTIEMILDFYKYLENNMAVVFIKC